MGAVTQSMRQLTLASATLVLLAAPGQGLETVRIGPDGDLDWKGSGSATVTPIAARYQSLLEANKLLEGNAPGQLIDFDSDQFVGAILPQRIQSGDNVATGTLARGGGINSPNVFDFSGTFKRLDFVSVEFLWRINAGNIHTGRHEIYQVTGLMLNGSIDF